MSAAVMNKWQAFREIIGHIELYIEYKSVTSKCSFIWHPLNKVLIGACYEYAQSKSHDFSRHFKHPRLMSLSLSSDRRSFTIVLWVVFSLTSSFPAICYNITEHNVLCSVWLVPMCHQGAALVHIYLDGSVLLSHGGVECGQGLHTKMIQVRS